MKFTEAKEKLKKIAGKKYHSLDYDVSTYENGTEEVLCSVYVAGHGWENGKTWENALSNIEKKIGAKETKPDPSEAPE